jgi:hypothetical protein
MLTSGLGCIVVLPSMKNKTLSTTDGCIDTPQTLPGMCPTQLYVRKVPLFLNYMP